MANYKLKFASSIKKDFRKIPKKDIKKILKIIDGLAENPFPQNVKKLSHQEKYRIRFRQYRILYRIEKKEVIVYVLKISHRKNVYRKS